MYPKAKFSVHVASIPDRSSVRLHVVCFRGREKGVWVAARAEEESEEEGERQEAARG